ncbi:hypothetical protein ASC65_13210 [Brevundimonas sp. Root1279]|nr:hypothetical protein ASC65_13210 [Brevundimonas sp. Root1279]
MRTRWTVKACEGLDAVALLGPLTGKPLYATRYASELEAIRPRLGEAGLAAVARLDAAGDRDGALLWPGLALILSGGPTDTLDAVLGAWKSRRRCSGRRSRPASIGMRPTGPGSWPAAPI